MYNEGTAFKERKKLKSGKDLLKVTFLSDRVKNQ